jgi:hypothetical protein
MTSIRENEIGELIERLRSEARTHQQFSSAIVDMRATTWFQAAAKLESLSERICEMEAEVERLTPRYAQPCFDHEYITPGCPDCGKLA